MYDELVKRLRGHANLVREYNEDGKLFDEAADSIEELIAESGIYRKEMTKEHNRAVRLLWEKEHGMPRWIPVTETPPLKVGDDGYNGYLIYANGYYAVADYTTDKFDNVPYFHVNGEYEPDVTHWQPLPDPPKEES